MALSKPIDVERFRTPLSPEAPAGKNLRADPDGKRLFSTLKDLRAEARRIEKDAEIGVDNKLEKGALAKTWGSALPTWRDVRDQSLGILEGTSSDLWVVQFLIEALVRTDGFEGLAVGFDVARELVATRWADLFPIPDPEDGPVDPDEERILPLAQLTGGTAGLLETAVMHVPLTGTDPADGYGLGHYQLSKSLRNASSEALENASVTPEQFDKALAATPPERIRGWFVAAAAAAERLNALQSAVKAASQGRVEMPTGRLVNLLEEARNVAKHHAEGVVATVEAAVAPVGGGEASKGGVVASGDPPLAKEPTTREDAIALLVRAAECFERSDPHSLVGAHIRHSVRLARMSREQFYRELLQEDATLRMLGRFVGLSFAAPDDSK
jgi:type VI secretion system protein ImpA